MKKLEPATIEALEILISELREGAAGPCDYWFRQLADRLCNYLTQSEKEK